MTLPTVDTDLRKIWLIEVSVDVNANAGEEFSYTVDTYGDMVSGQTASDPEFKAPNSGKYFVVFKLKTSGAIFNSTPVNWTEPTATDPDAEKPTNSDVHLYLGDASKVLIIEDHNQGSTEKNYHFELRVDLGGTTYVSPDPIIMNEPDVD